MEKKESLLRNRRLEKLYLPFEDPFKPAPPCVSVAKNSRRPTPKTRRFKIANDSLNENSRTESRTSIQSELEIPELRFESLSSTISLEDVVKFPTLSQKKTTTKLVLESPYQPKRSKKPSIFKTQLSPKRPSDLAVQSRSSGFKEQVKSTTPVVSKNAGSSKGFHKKSVKVRKGPPSVQDRSDKNRDENLDLLLARRNANDLNLLMNEYLKRKQLSETTKVFVGGADHIKRALVKKGWVENKNPSSIAFHLKWTISDSDNDYKQLLPGQLFNHFFNNRQLTTKSGLLKNMRNVSEYGVNPQKIFPRCYDLGDSVQLQEFISDYNQTAVFSILRYYSGLHKKGASEPTNLGLLKSAITYGQSFIEKITDRCEQTERLNSSRRRFYTEPEINGLVELSQSLPPKNIPETWEFPPDYMLNAVVHIVKKLDLLTPQASLEDFYNIWILKPGQNARGSGVKCLRDLQEILDSGKMQSRVVQKYVETPLLLPTSIGQCKFDIRQWVLVTSFEPLTVYFYNSCYLRLCQQTFTLDNLDPYRHLANYTIQKTAAKSQEDTVWSLLQFREYLSGQGVDYDSQVLPGIHSLIISTLKSVSESIETKEGCFELYGFDLILDRTYKPWLLEVNLSPACAERTGWMKEMLDCMSEGLLEIVLESSVPSGNKSDTNEWVLLYKGELPPEGEVETMMCNLEVCGEKLNIRREKQMERKFVLTRAALTIQKVAREFIARVRVRRAKETKLALLIQSVFKRIQSKERLREQVRVVSAVLVQSHFRRFLAQKELKKLKKEKAIKYIQAHLKGAKSRNNYKNIRQKRACVVLQKSFRRKLAYISRVKALNYRSKVLRVQRFWKRRFKLLKKQATSIQRTWRGYKGRLAFDKEKAFQNSIKVIKCSIKRKVAYEHCKHLKYTKGALLLRSILKKGFAFICLQTCLEAKSSIVIQKHFRRHKATQLLNKMKHERKQLLAAVVNIQSHLKGKLERNKFKSCIENKAALSIQRVYKGYLAREYFRILKLVHRSATKIQKFYRGFKGRRKFQMLLRIRKQEHQRKTRQKKLKREQEIRAIQASERLFKNRASVLGTYDNFKQKKGISKEKLFKRNFKSSERTLRKQEQTKR